MLDTRYTATLESYKVGFVDIFSVETPRTNFLAHCVYQQHKTTSGLSVVRACCRVCVLLTRVLYDRKIMTTRTRRAEDDPP